LSGAVRRSAAVGVYSVAAHVAVQRRYELGVRLALGATARQLFALVVRQALRPVLIGAVLGIGAALASGGLLGSFLFEIGPTDPGAFGAATVLLLVSPCSPAIFRRAAPRKRTRS
jgi:ABC-type antimicrobial peptide transport system permease subunit